MYEPQAFRVVDADELASFIEAYPLGFLVTHGEGGLSADPLPFLLVRSSEGVRLRAHVARANPHWRRLAAPKPALVLFRGPDHYISPGWYATKAETHRVVPTWNYMTAEAEGLARAIDDPHWVRSLVGELTAAHERRMPQPWSMADAPADFIDAQLRAIVGIEVEVSALRGKFKLSQNRPQRDVASTHSALAAGDARAQAVAGQMDRWSMPAASPADRAGD